MCTQNVPYIRCAYRIVPHTSCPAHIKVIHCIWAKILYKCEGNRMHACRAPKHHTSHSMCYIQLTDIRMAIDLELRKQTQWDAAIEQIFVEAGRMVVQMGLGNGFGTSGFGTSGALHPPMPSLMAWTHRLLVTLQLTSGRYHRQLAIAALYRYCFSCSPPRWVPMPTCHTWYITSDLCYITSGM